MKMEVQFISRPAVKLAGYMLKTSSRNGENLTAVPKFWADYMNSGRMEKLHREGFVKNHAEYGACFSEDSAGNFDYVIGVEIKNAAGILPCYTICEIPAASYAVFSTPPADAASFSGAIQETWRRISGEWLPQAGREIDEAGAAFELYDERCMGETGKVCGIYIPLKEK